jgi:hypothetical protein
MEASCYDYDIKKGASVMIPAQDLQTVQRILQELREYGQAHADEAWATFLNAKVEEALDKLPDSLEEEEDYVPFSDQTLAERYTSMREDEAKQSMDERVRKLRAPNSLFADINGELE